MRAKIKEFDGKNAEHAPEAESRDFSEERGSSGTLKRGGKENIIHCLLTKSKHAQLTAKKKKKAVYSGLIMEKKSILGLLLP